MSSLVRSNILEALPSIVPASIAMEMNVSISGGMPAMWVTGLSPLRLTDVVTSGTPASSTSAVKG